MHALVITRFVGILTVFLGLAMLPPLAFAVLFQDGSSRALAISAVITTGFGLTLFLITRSQRDTQLSHRDGVAIVTLGWITARTPASPTSTTPTLIRSSSSS